MRHNIQKNIASISVLIFACASPTLVWAQDASSGPSGSLQGTDSAAVGEIVVTAEKRSVSINKVGLTVAAFGADDLDRQQISDIRDLTKIVPGLTYAESPSSSPIYTLRGVGFNDTTLAAYPPVAVYVDQIPLPFPAMTTQAGLDLERVEVLKGPQGILFGQNTTGGAINYIAAKPTSEFSAGADLSWGRFNRVDFESYLSGPLSDTLRGRVAVKLSRGDDWQYSMSRPDEGNGKRRLLVGRVLLDWEPSDRLSFELNVNGWLNKSDPQAGQVVQFNPQVPNTPIITAFLAKQPLAPDKARVADWRFHPRQDGSLYQFALTTNYNLAGDVGATLLTSYVKYKKDDIDSNSGFPLRNFDLTTHTGFVKTFSQEARLANGADNSFRWTAGLNYQRTTADEKQTFDYTESTVAEGFGFVSNDLRASQKLETKAAFANVDWDVIPDVTLKGGVRYTKASARVGECIADTGDGLTAATFSFISSSITGQNVVIPPGECYTLNQFTFLPGLYEDKFSEDNLSWRAGVDFRPSSNLLLYANATRGYKAGGFPVLGATSTAQLAPVRQESVLALEAGFKAQLLDRKVSLTGAVFHYDYRDKQVRTKSVDLIFGVLDTTANIPKSRVQGAELNLLARPIDGLDLSASATYVDGKVKKYVGIDNLGVTTDFSGARLPFVPKLALSGTVDYSWPIGSMEASIGTTVTYQSSTSSVVGGDAVTRIPSYTLVDLRASIKTQDGWEFGVWGRNVFNEFYWTNVVRVFDTSVRYTGMPATYGVRASYKY